MTKRDLTVAQNIARIEVVLAVLGELRTDAAGNVHGVPFDELQQMVDRLHRWRGRYKSELFRPE